MARKFEIVVWYSEDYESLEFTIMLVNGESRKRLTTLSEYKIVELNPMFDDVEQVREYAEGYATTLANELGIAEVVWNYNNVL